MLDLLSVSESNLDEVSKQAWFKRVWDTEWGSNKQRERINAINLCKAQKCAGIFLIQLGRQNELLMKSIYAIATQARVNSIRNIKLQAYISELIDETRKVAYGYSEEDLTE